MGRPYSVDLRERVVSAVEKGRMSRRQAASHFGVGIKTAIDWVRLFRTTGNVAPGKMGGHKPKAIRGEHHTWLAERIREKDFTIRGLVAELAERDLKVDYRSVWNFVHAEGLSFKKKLRSLANGIVPTSHAGVSSGPGTAVGSNLRAWSSSMRHGPRPTWRRSGGGRHGAQGSRPRFRMATGKP
jgi:putative transposase